MRRLSAAAVRRPRRRLGRRLGWWFGVQRLAGGRPHRPSAVRQLGAAARCGDSVRRLGATAQATAQGTARAAACCGGSVRVLRRLLGAAAQATARMVARGAETHKRETASSPRLPRVEPPPPSCAARRAGSCAWRATTAVGGDGVWRRGSVEAGECGGSGRCRWGRGEGPRGGPMRAHGLRHRRKVLGTKRAGELTHVATC